MITKLGFLGVVAVSLSWPVVARAGDAAAVNKAQIAACQACHAGDGAAQPPRLAGQRGGYLAKQLKAFKSGDRKARVMNALAGELNEADIDNLAAYWSAQPAGSDATVPPEVAAIRASKMKFPREFPTGFTLYSTWKKEEQRVVAKAYVNKVGFDAAKAGKPLPDGSIIVLINHNAKLDAESKPVVDKDGGWVAGDIKNYEGMEARAGWGKDIPEALRNNNWSYAVFSPDKAPRNEVNQAVCLACHRPIASSSFVFGLEKMQTTARAK
jgi:cytochrome c553